jgi:hypothetical protein
MSLDAEELYDYVTQEMTGAPAHECVTGVPLDASDVRHDLSTLDHYPEQTHLSAWDDDDSWDDEWADEWDEDDEDDDDWDDDWDDDDDDWDEDDDWVDEEDEWEDDFGGPDFFDTRSEAF